MKELTEQDFYKVLNAVYDTDRTEAIALLGENPALLETRSGTGETVLHYVVVENEQEMVEWLVKQGANINPVNDFGETPLMNATALGYSDLCRFMTENGADMRFVSEAGESALSKAVEGNNMLLVQLYLAQLSPDEDVNRHFDDIDAHCILKQGDDIAIILRGRGLTDPYE